MIYLIYQVFSFVFKLCTILLMYKKSTACLCQRLAVLTLKTDEDNYDNEDVDNTAAVKT